MSGFVLLLLSAAACRVGADEDAATTLVEMVEWIETGKFANNFFHGDVIQGSPATDVEEVAGCLLDKVGAIVEENGVKDFANDLQVDLAACCTKDKAACLEDVGEAYSLLAKAKTEKPKKVQKASGQIAGMILNAVEKRVESGRVKSSHSHYFGKCPDSLKCSISKLKGKSEI
mmetsp:Transcript_61036/g.108624  ORF Transcript_61036/g.108624 Transcript_61036/m.108624 type:complete len:173 (+) Transcript_61036:48-566(+)